MGSATDEVAVSLLNLVKMLEARGDDCSSLKTDIANIEPGTFYSSLVALSSNNTQVFYTLTKEALRDFTKKLKDMSVDEMQEEWGVVKYVVIEKTAQNNTVVLDDKDKLLQAEGGFLQLFNIKYLLYNPTEHVYTPKHEKLPETEIKKLLETYQLKNRFQLPIIPRTEIMARYLGLVHGDVVKITRITPTSGQSNYYRCCM